KTSWSIDFNENYENNYYNSKMFLGQPAGEATSATSRLTSLINEQTLSYTTTIRDKHALQVVIGNTLQKDSYALTSIDRKSTRLNSSHVKISYAVFCLKKKKNKKQSIEEKT